MYGGRIQYGIMTGSFRSKAAGSICKSHRRTKSTTYNCRHVARASRGNFLQEFFTVDLSRKYTHSRIGVPFRNKYSKLNADERRAPGVNKLRDSGKVAPFLTQPHPER